MSQDSYGAEVVTWAEFAAVWAGIEPLSGREFITEQQSGQGELTTRIRMRYLAGVKAEDRIVVGSRVFDVEAVLPDEREREMMVMARELVE